MQGMRFLLMGEKGPINHGIITQRVTEEKYLCTFMRNPQSSRLCTTDEIAQWNLFPNDESMNLFIATLQQQDPNAPSPDGRPPAGKPPGVDQHQAKKKAKKKVSKKKAKAKKQNRK